MIRRLSTCLLTLICFAGSPAQSPTIFTPSVLMTASGQTSSPIRLGQSYSSITVTLTGSSLTTATVGLLGSADNGVTYTAVAMQKCSVPGTFATTETATTAACYQANSAGFTHLEFVTSGTFTATSITLVVSGSTNAQITYTPGPTGPTGSTGATGPTGATAPVYSCGTTTTCSNTLLAAPHIVTGTATLTAGGATVTGLTPAFTSSSTFTCISNDISGVTLPSNAVPASGSSITLSGTGSDVIIYTCTGN